MITIRHSLKPFDRKDKVNIDIIDWYRYTRDSSIQALDPTNSPEAYVVAMTEMLYVRHGIATINLGISKVKLPERADRLTHHATVDMQMSNDDAFVFRLLYGG